LEDGGSVGGSPGIEKVVLSCGDKPLATVGELEAEDTALVEIELIFVWLRCVENLDVGVLHANSKPVTSRTVAQAEYLAAEVVLLELSALPEVPGPHSVVQASGPQLGAVCGDVNAACPVRVSLELSDKGLVVEVPDRDVAITAAAEADLGVWADGQSVAGRG